MCDAKSLTIDFVLWQVRAAGLTDAAYIGVFVDEVRQKHTTVPKL
jgi:hypothetical protein